MLVKQIREDLKSTYSEILTLTNKLLKIEGTNEILRNFINAIISRDLAHPLPENRISGFITLTKVLSHHHIDRVVRVLLAEKLSESLLTNILEYLACQELYRLLISRLYLGRTTAYQIVEQILQNLTLDTLYVIDKFLEKSLLYLCSLRDFDFELTSRHVLLRLFLTCQEERLHERDQMYKNVKIVLRRVADYKYCLEFRIEITSNIERVISRVLIEPEVKVGLLSYQLILLS